MHKHVAPRRLPNPIIIVAGLALILTVIIAGLAVITTQRPDQPQALITASEHAVITPERVSVTTAPGTVQDWTPEEQQIPVKPIGAPEVGATVCEEDMPCWDCETMGNGICGGTEIAATTAVCEEDMPCWDCATMGNMVCGTIDDSAAAWAAWEANGGACLLSMDESRPFRVDYMASTPETPENLTATDVAVQGADGTWYVFHASYTDIS